MEEPGGARKGKASTNSLGGEQESNFSPRSGTARSGLERLGKARLDWERRCSAWNGDARNGKTRQTRDTRAVNSVTIFTNAWHGSARRGPAQHGEEGPVAEGQGKDRQD